MLERVPLKHRPFYYRRYVDDIFVLFNSPEHFKRFQSYFNSRHANISFTIVNEKDNRMSVLDVNVIREQGKSTFSGIYTHFDSFLSSTYKTGMIHIAM